jgi:hypothetical protein
MFAVNRAYSPRPVTSRPMLARFWNNCEGASPPAGDCDHSLMCAVGAAVDLSRVNYTRAAFQDALTLTKYAQDMDQGALSMKATDLFGALFTRPEAYDIAIQTPLRSKARQLRGHNYRLGQGQCDIRLLPRQVGDPRLNGTSRS